MATRYLIGTGNRNWNDTANWSATSGGVGGASVPTLDDDVYFDSNSGTGTVTVNAIANMLDFTCTNIGAITLSNAAYAFNVYGSLTLHTSLTVTFTSTGYLYMKATDSRNITTNGKVANWNRMYFNGVGGTWTLQDILNIGSGTVIYLANGTFNTNNQNIKPIGIYPYFNIRLDIGIKTLILGNSQIGDFPSVTLGTVDIDFNTNKDGFTFDCGTSVIYGRNSLYSGGFTFYKYYGTYSTGFFLYNGLICDTFEMSGIVDYRFVLILFNELIITNNLILNGVNSSNNRLLIVSGDIGTPCTITCNGTVTASNVDFRDIVGAGTANWDLSTIEGGSGDCGGNSGITFTPAQTQYFKHTLGAVDWSDATKWFSNYERTIQGRVPLPQDDAIFDENSFTGASTLNVNVPRIGGLNMEGVNQGIIINSSSIECYKGMILSNIITANFGVNFIGVGNYFIDVKNKCNIGLFYRGNYTILSNIKGSSCVIGRDVIIDFNGFSGTFYSIQAYSYGKSTVNLRNGTLTITGPAGQPFAVAGLPTIWYFENSTIKFTPIGSYNYIPLTLGNGNKSVNKVHLSGSHSGNFDILEGFTFNELIIDLGRKVRFTAGTTQNISKLTAIGIPTNPIKIDSTTTSRFNLVKTGSEPNECNFIDISNSNASPSGSWPAGYNSNDMGNNAGWEFNTDDFVPQIINL